MNGVKVKPKVATEAATAYLSQFRQGDRPVTRDMPPQEPMMSTTPSTPTPHDQAQLQAGALRVLKRNGRVVEYSDEKLALALSKAFQAVEGNSPAALEKIE